MTQIRFQQPIASPAYPNGFRAQSLYHTTLQRTRRSSFVLFAFVFLTIQILQTQPTLSQSPIVLRDLTLIRDKTISSFDRSAIQLSDGSKLDWDQVLKAELADEEGTDLTQRQAQFDGFVKQIGLPLFRLKTRIQQGDWAGAGKISDPIFDSVMTGTSSFPSPDVEYLVCLATMKSRAGQGRSARNSPPNRAGAVLPFLHASSVQAIVSQSTLAIVGTDPIAQDREGVLSPDLLPIWFDSEQVRRSAKQLSQLVEPIESSDSINKTNSQKVDQTALAIYLASMQIELDQNELANATLSRLGRNQSKLIESWLLVLRARTLQRAGDHVGAQAMLDRNSKSIVGDARPVAIYYRGLSEFEIHAQTWNAESQSFSSVVDTELSKSALMLIRLPALYGESHPSLAAAGLFQAAEIAKLRGQFDESKKLSQQLLQRYPRTYHGNLKPDAIDTR